MGRVIAVAGKGGVGKTTRRELREEIEKQALSEIISKLGL